MRLSAYRVMWLFVFFDCPTETKKDRKQYAKFRKKIMEDGFTMMQYSVYIRHCASYESATVHIKRVKSFIPPKGNIAILPVTDKQFGNMANFWGKEEKPIPQAPKQLELF